MSTVRLRVLMVDSERGWRGGQAQVLLLMRGLVDAGVEVHLAAPGREPLFARAAALAVERHAWEPAGPASVWRLRQLITRGDYDVVHSHAARAHGLSSLACAGLRPPPRHVVSRRVDFPVGRGVIGRIKYRHGADAYIAISRGVRDVLIAGGVPAGRVYIAESGIDLGKFSGLEEPARVRLDLGIRSGERVVGCVAALAPHKSHADLLRAAAIVRDRRDDVRFVLVGDGALRGALVALARELGIADAVVFTGFREDALSLLRAFDVFVLSSYLEGLGTSIMDAQALRVPVVATKVGGIPEIVEDGLTGLLVPPREPALLAGAVLRMLDDNALREACADEAYRRSTAYDYKRMVHKTLDVYRRVCEVRISA